MYILEIITFWYKISNMNNLFKNANKMLALGATLLIAGSLVSPVATFAVTDWCSNFDGVQTSLPANTKRPNEGDVCIPINSTAVAPSDETAFDRCSNLPQFQPKLPSNYGVRDGSTICYLINR